VLGCDRDCFFILHESPEEIGNPDENSELLRVVTGGHIDEIVTVAYSIELSLIVTGTVNGELAIWDYEYSRLLDFGIAHASEITSINFLWPYPIMLTTSIDGQAIFWKVRSVNKERQTLEVLYRFINKSYNID